MLEKKFSAREIEIAKLFAAGLRLKEISCETGLKQSTIATYSQRFKEKIGVTSNVDMVDKIREILNDEEAPTATEDANTSLLAITGSIKLTLSILEHLNKENKDLTRRRVLEAFMNTPQSLVLIDHLTVVLRYITNFGNKIERNRSNTTEG